MAGALVIGGALANCGREVSTDELLEFLSEQSPDLQLFRYTPRGPAMAALDWQAILNTSASLVVFGQLFWAAYKRFIEPRLRARPDDDCFLFLTVRGPGHSFAQFKVGRDYATQEEFISDFVRQASALREAEGGATDIDLQWRFSEDDSWVPFRTDRSGHS